MKNLTTKIFTVTILASFLMFAACGKSETKTTTSESKTTTSESKNTATTSVAGSPTSLVKDIYDNATKRNCAAIPPLLTDDFKKAVGTSKDELDALCDSFTDSGKLTNIEVKGEEIKGETASVKVLLTFKDGKKEEKSENLKKVGDKWLMDS